MTELMENNDRTAAQWKVDRFVRQFEPGYRSLVQLAAVPIVLTPELVSYLRGQFLPKLTWVAEADLLLSELCRSVGYERYVMDSGVQAIALQELEARSPEQVEDIARLLVGYMQHLARVNPYLTDRQRKHQQWAAMLCVAEMREEAIGQIALEFEIYAGMIAQSESFGAGRSELAWLATIVQELSPRLLEYSGLVKLAVTISEAVREPEKIDRSRLQERYAVGERELSFPVGLLGNQGDINHFSLCFWDIDINFLRYRYSELSNVNNIVPPLQTFEFETVTIDEGAINEIERDKNLFLTKKNEPESLISKDKEQAAGYIDCIDNETSIEMIAIPKGEFLMGAPESELESSSSERPQHLVMVPGFWMGRCPVTQAQWSAVAKFPQVDIELQENPSHFRGSDLPVEQVSWNEAIEFCARLSISTGREYCLPSEAQWEYACRSGTTTRFHFGEMIDSELINYDAKGKDFSGYGNNVGDEYREGTTPVMTFPANSFGLCDMHGNVWEWCMDRWHSNYENAPDDGSAWLRENESAQAPRVLRGGSWLSEMYFCRSSHRDRYTAGYRGSDVGFRIVHCPSPYVS